MTLVLGVDISKTKLNAAVKTLNNQKQNSIDLGEYSNEIKAFQALAKKVSEHLQPGEKILLVVEPSGGYEQPLAHFALKQGWQVSMPNPYYVRQWAKGIGVRAKTDQVDARTLAKYGASHPLPEWKPLPKDLQSLDRLLKREEDLKETLRQEQNRLGALEFQEIEVSVEKESIHRSIKWLSEELDNINKQLKGFLKQHRDLNEQARKLRSIPGVGARNSLFLLVLLHKWNILTDAKGNHKGLVAYIGLDPVPHQSGTSVYKRPGISRQGDPVIRALLYLGAMSSSRWDNPLGAFYKRLVDRGKKKKVALVAAARKILVWAWAIFKSGSVFDPKKAISLQ